MKIDLKRILIVSFLLILLVVVVGLPASIYNISSTSQSSINYISNQWIQSDGTSDCTVVYDCQGEGEDFIFCGAIDNSLDVMDNKCNYDYYPPEEWNFEYTCLDSEKIQFGSADFVDSSFIECACEESDFKAFETQQTKASIIDSMCVVEPNPECVQDLDCSINQECTQDKVCQDKEVQDLTMWQKIGLWFKSLWIKIKLMFGVGAE